MRHGADREEIEPALAEMATTRPGIAVHLHRGRTMIRDSEGEGLVSEEGDHYASDPLLQQAVAQGEEISHDSQGIVRFLFPIPV
ncbi:MAG: hypothetical protein FD153_2011 [Rhodospirillaceae bacterium]|nr:MAG: hypothetical protein FD153_2011 [Rhodospirillaceae bacterium]